MKYVIGTGYHWRSEWDEKMANIWIANTEKYSPSWYCACTIHTMPQAIHTKQIFCNHNLGHVGDLIKENRSGLCGWSASVVTLALIAYNCGRDFIYKEADCLWFGDILGKMYQDCGDKGMVFGAKMDAAPWMACAQSTFLIKHWFILEFVRDYLALPDDKDMLPEDKFVKLEENAPDNYRRLSFGVDRMRPLPWDAEVWYAQQWSEEEIKEAQSRGLL
jgi:hypothetical protein